MDSSTDVKALTCPRWATGEVSVTVRHILADTLRGYDLTCVLYEDQVGDLREEWIEKLSEVQ